jgi:hypothetical protein
MRDCTRSAPKVRPGSLLKPTPFLADSGLTFGTDRKRPSLFPTGRTYQSIAESQRTTQKSAANLIISTSAFIEGLFFTFAALWQTKQTIFPN